MLKKFSIFWVHKGQQIICVHKGQQIIWESLLNMAYPNQSASSINHTIIKNLSFFKTSWITLLSVFKYKQIMILFISLASKKYINYILRKHLDIGQFSFSLLFIELTIYQQISYDSRNLHQDYGIKRDLPFGSSFGLLIYQNGWA